MQETELAKQQRHRKHKIPSESIDPNMRVDDAVMKAFQSALDMLNPNPGA